jgi:hypothetical protein
MDLLLDTGTIINDQNQSPISNGYCVQIQPFEGFKTGTQPGQHIKVVSVKKISFHLSLF